VALERTAAAMADDDHAQMDLSMVPARASIARRRQLMKRRHPLLTEADLDRLVGVAA
jgi:hypothetical protein